MADRRVTWGDLGLTAALLIVGLNGTGPAAANQGQTVPGTGYALVVAACLPIVVWRWQPLWALAGAAAATAVYLALGYAYGPIMFALVVAVYGVASREPVRRTVAATAVLVAASFAALGVEVLVGDRGWPEFLTATAWMIAWLIIPAAIGLVVKARRDAAADVRAAQARRAVSEERLQLAQEMHDVAGHGLAVIAMQAGVALRMLERDPAKVRSSLEAIRDTSKDALDGLRVELEALRHGPEGADAPLRPHAGLGDLDRLAERIRSSGLPVTVDAEDGCADVPVVVDRAAYRIVQEALTNVLRHGGPEATARVRVAKDGGVLDVEVVDTGQGAAAPAGGGHGIAGMRERAEALGGTLEAGPRPAGGFAVRARLPVRDSAQSAEGSP